MKQNTLYLAVLMSILLLLSACGESESEAASLSPEAVSSYTGSAPAVHMQLKIPGTNTTVCKVSNTPASTRPTAQNCPSGTYTEQLFGANWKQIGENKTVTIGGGSATFSHTGSAAAVHMQLKIPGTNNIVCKAENTSASTKPTAQNCPSGTYTEQLFGANWKQIGLNKAVTIGGGTTTPPSDTPPNPGEAPIRNLNSDFFQFQNTPSDQLPFDQLTEEISKPFDGGFESAGGAPRFGAGNFRVSCQYSHFSYDDPILKPGQQGAAHLHMFFGKTNADYNTNKDNIASSGGGTCNGFALNRSAYWTPALLNDSGKAVIPKQILVYYKSSRVDLDGVNRMPHGLELLGGNIKGSAKARVPSKDSFDVFWSCGVNGSSRKDVTKSGTLTELDVKCRNDEPINATIYFPQCIAKTAAGGIKLKSDDDDALSHTHRLKGVNDKCPATHPVRIPELAILLYYPSLKEMNQSSLQGWKLSSDMGAAPGSTLHADWMGGWQDKTMDLWVNNCNRAKRNCSIGQTGTADRLKHKLTGSSSFDWTGPDFVTPPKKAVGLFPMTH